LGSTKDSKVYKILKNMRVVKQNVLALCLTLSTTFAGMTAGAIPFNVVSVLWDEAVTSKIETVLENKEDAALKAEKKEQAQNVDAYFAKMNLPLAGYGEAFVETAEKYDLDYRLLPAIAMRESTGGKQACWNDKDNVFGWHSCKITFKSQEEAIDKVGAHLAGEIKSTRGYYGNKTVWKKLRTYNSVIKAYPDEVISIMNKIEKGVVQESVVKIEKLEKKDLREVAINLK
jgi:hypothetical protein